VPHRPIEPEPSVLYKLGYFPAGDDADSEDPINATLERPGRLQLRVSQALQRQISRKGKSGCGTSAEAFSPAIPRDNLASLFQSENLLSLLQ
jgi:hypothetical protein